MLKQIYFFRKCRDMPMETTMDYYEVQHSQLSQLAKADHELMNT
jgi:hypothetical protein